MSVPETATGKSRITTWRDLAVIAAVGVVVRALLIQLEGTWGTPHLWEYDDIAENMLAGRGFVHDYRGIEYRTFTTPGWPFVLSVLLRIGDYRLVQCFQILMCVLLGASAYVVARNTWGRRAGLFAGVLCVLHPGLVYYSVMNSDPLPLNALVVFLTAAALLRLSRAPGSVNAVLAGVLIGGSMLTRGTTVLLLPLAAVWLFFSVGWRRMAWSMTIMLLTSSAIVAPWLLRNLAAVNAPVITSTSGEMLWWGNNPNASGGVEAVNGSHMRSWVPPAVLSVVESSPSELVHNQTFRNEALRFIWGNPTAFVSLSLSKFRQFWWFGPFYGKEYPDWYLTLYRPLYAIELLLAAAGIVIGLRSKERMTAWLLISVPLAISVFQSLFYVQGRHRWMVESFVILFVALAANHMSAWMALRPTGAERSVESGL
jgi:4-amino-4-deoxy-L-arabinose transferase-like glycosyltransferase